MRSIGEWNEGSALAFGRLVDAVFGYIITILQFQKAAKRTPEIASLNLRLHLSATNPSLSSVPAIDKDAKRIIDIFRGTYLQTRQGLRLDQLGRFWLGLEMPQVLNGFVAWEVRPSLFRKAIVSGFAFGTEVAHYAVDPRGSV